MNELQTKILQTPIEIALKIDSTGCTTARKLYEWLELDPSHYTRWVKEYITDNPFVNNNEFSPLMAKTSKQGGRPTIDYKITASFAKKLAMASKSPKGEITREYFLKCEQILAEKAIPEWHETRIAGKVTRLQETDVIKQLAEYAKQQGSGHSDKLYLVYSKLAKTVVQNGRDELTITELNTLNMIEDMILKTIQADMCLNMGYKHIYQDCKNKLEQFKNIMYLG